MNVSLRMGNRRLAQAEEGGAPLGLKAVVAMLAVLTAAGLFYAYTAVRSLNISYELSRELDNQREQMEVGRRLKVEINSLRSPERLEREAARTGLAAPRPEQARGLK
jgi:cell division protein FtsL